MFKNKEQTKVHFIGIGGIGMSGIAEILIRSGYKVSGSDLKGSAITDGLKALGVEVFIGHEESNIKDDVNVVVYSTAIDKSNPEVQVSNKKKIPLIRRAEMLTELMRLRYGLAVAGTHGKTTTSSILATILHECGVDITHVIGGVVANLGGNAKLGKSEFLVAEADESDGSFLLLNPVISVITNIDNDHLDFYGSEKNIFNAFVEFSNKVPFYGTNVLCAHDSKLQKLISITKKPYKTFGFYDSCDYQAIDLEVSGMATSFKVKSGDIVVSAKLNMIGEHNVLNALGAIAAADQILGDLEKVCFVVSSFSGVGRRFEKLYDKNNFQVFDDYGHHPTEVEKTLETAKKYFKDDLTIIFEPHRFSRTKDCWNEFINCFKGIENVYLLPIYAASEKPTEGISSEKLVAAIDGANFLDSWQEAKKLLDQKNKSGGAILTLGAGSIGRNIREYVAGLK